MRSSTAPILYWSYWANVIYILGMFGYLTIDTITYIVPTFNNTFSSSIYICLAIVFVVDAVLYTIDWYMYAVKLRENQDAPIGYRAEFVALYFSKFGKLFLSNGCFVESEQSAIYWNDFSNEFNWNDCFFT